MKINFVRLQNFRNVEFAEADLDSRSVWICGQNAQGKTNLLEALGLLPALRSFRTQNLKALVRQSCKEAAILACVETCGSEYNEIEIRISNRRSVRIDGSEIDKFSDYIGKFPALAMTSEDIRILRDSPDVRRKDVDMFISSIDPQYFAALKKYYAALPHRNALLKDGEQSSAIYEPFELQMAEAAADISQKRQKWLDEIGEIAGIRYAVLARENGEDAKIRLKSPYSGYSAEDFSKLFERERNADLEARLTRKGPHRDDMAFYVAGRDAKLYASEGQQRSAVIALKLAQFEIQKRTTKTEPPILCDDILGELDAYRRAAFWDCVSPTAQVIATSTIPAPADGIRSDWKTITVSNGKFQ